MTDKPTEIGSKTGKTRTLKPAETSDRGVFSNIRPFFSRGILQLGNSRFEFVLLTAVISLTSYLHLTYASSVKVNIPIRADAAQYTLHAFNLANHGIFSGDKTQNPKPGSNVPPLFPMMLSLLLKDNPAPDTYVLRAYNMMAALNILSVALFYLLLRVSLGVIPAMAGAAALGTSPHVISMTGYILTEAPYLFALVLFFFTLSLALKKTNLPLFLAAGVSAGLCLLLRPVFLLTIPFMALLLVLDFREQKRRALKICGSFLLGFVLVYSPWVVRNLLISQNAIGSSGTMRATIGMGMYPGLVHKNPEDIGFPYRDDPRFQEITSSYGSMLGELAARFRAEPGRYVTWYLFGKPLMLWRWSILVGQGDIFIYPIEYSAYQDKAIFRVTYRLWKTTYPLFLFSAFAGVVIFLWRRQYRHEKLILTYIIGFLAATTALHVITVGLPRHSIPLRPFLIFLAIWGLMEGSITLRRVVGGKSQGKTTSQIPSKGRSHVSR